jgi:chaperone modulatory protein CbpM
MTERYAMTVHRRPARRLDREEFARRSGVHPDLLRRLVALGLVPAVRDTGGELRFAAVHVAEVARIERLRQGLGLNYLAVGLVCELLDRIRSLERELRERSH